MRRLQVTANLQRPVQVASRAAGRKGPSEGLRLITSSSSDRATR